jgi:inhibitor of cysteine peptidase
VKRFLPLFLIAVQFCACAHLGHKPAPLALEPADNGKTVNMVVGEQATLRLPANPGTGYRWETISAPDARILIVVDTGYDRPTPDLPGASGQAWWKLRATGAGSTSFAVRYVRPWEPDEKAQEFTLNVTVK